MDYDNDVNYTNELKSDLESLKPPQIKLRKPTRLFKFDKSPSSWFVEWDNKYIARFNKQKIGKRNIVAMKRHLDEEYIPELVLDICDMYDAKALYFTNLISKSYFTYWIKQLRK